VGAGVAPAAAAAMPAAMTSERIRIARWYYGSGLEA
jgi:hypothetical protein